MNIATGYEGGGTGGGDVVSFFYDGETLKTLIGENRYAGSFMGSMERCDICEYKNGEAKKIIPYARIGQIAENHDRRDLIKNVE